MMISTRLYPEIVFVHNYYNDSPVCNHKSTGCSFDEIQRKLRDAVFSLNVNKATQPYPINERAQ